MGKEPNRLKTLERIMDANVEMLATYEKQYGIKTKDLFSLRLGEAKERLDLDREEIKFWAILAKETQRLMKKIHGIREEQRKNIQYKEIA